MADLCEAFTTYKFKEGTFQNIDYFFTQKTLLEDSEYIDNNMNRTSKKIKIIKNFLALNIPTIITTNTVQYGDTVQTYEKPDNFDIEIFGDEGYHYKGTITSYRGIIPNFMIPIKDDKKLFVHINYNLKESNTKTFINFIEVPKRFQNIDNAKDDNNNVT
jgi:hypothetical protein